MSIDPGSNIGISIYTISVDYTDTNMVFNIESIETNVIVLENYIPEYNIANNKLLSKLHILKDVLENLLIEHDPSVVAVEEAFANMRFPLAVIQLSQYLGIILQTVSSFNPFLKVFKYAPKLIKKYVGSGGNANKDDMLSTVSKISEIVKHVDITKLTEHEIDSLAIGYITLQHIRQHPLVMCAI